MSLKNIRLSQGTEARFKETIFHKPGGSGIKLRVRYYQ